MKYSEHVLKSPPYSQTATLTRIQTWNSVWWITYSALFLYWILILDFWGWYWHDTGLTYAEDGGSWIHWYSFYLYVPLPRHFSWQSYPKRTSRGVQHVAKSKLPTMTHMLNCMTLLSFSISKHDSFHDLKIVFCSFLLMLSASHSTWAENQMHKTNKLWDELEKSCRLCSMKLLFFVYSDILWPKMHELCVSTAPLQTLWYSRNSKGQRKRCQAHF